MEDERRLPRSAYGFLARRPDTGSEEGEEDPGERERLVHSVMVRRRESLLC